MLKHIVINPPPFANTYKYPAETYVFANSCQQWYLNCSLLIPVLKTGQL
jgi:hypothetical protein